MEEKEKRRREEEKKRRKRGDREETKIKGKKEGAKKNEGCGRARPVIGWAGGWAGVFLGWLVTVQNSGWRRTQNR